MAFQFQGELLMNIPKRKPGRPKGSKSKNSVVDFRETGYLYGDVDIKTPLQLRDENIRLTKEIEKLKGIMGNDSFAPNIADDEGTFLMEEICVLFRRWADPESFSRIASLAWDCRTSSFEWKYKKPV